MVVYNGISFSVKSHMVALVSATQVGESNVGISNCSLDNYPHRLVPTQLHLLPQCLIGMPVV